jgi:carotenoid cleavage dioxygenase-like enzyme
MAIASQSVAERPFYLSGNFAPVSEEVTAFDLPVEGEIPKELAGLYLRNGPNPQGRDEGHWFLGDGMLHGVRLQDGKAQWYRNRWVRTRSFLEGAQFIDEQGNVDRTVAKANTHVVAHAGRIFALVESSYPTELTPELETIGICDFEGRLRTAMTAHPKWCPRTGELHFFGYGFFPPFLTYHVLDAAGRLVRSEEISVPGPTMMHDFAITDRHVIFMDLPIVFNLEKAMQGGLPYEWSDDYGARLGVLPRNGGSADVRWFEIDPCYVFHPFNAFEREGRIVIDVARYPELWRGGSNTFAAAFAHRWTIDPASGRVTEQRLDDRAIEFPRIDDRRGGSAHRFGYAVANHSGVSDEAQELVKYDFERGTCVAHAFPRGCAPGEGVFVPSDGGASDDAGYVLAYVYDGNRDGSDLVILDAAAFTAPPLAKVRLPQRVPFGFHGNWISDRMLG